MRKIILVAGCAIAAASVPATAREGAGPAGVTPCYIEVPKLIAAPPAGIEELGAAIHRLEETLRPEVDDVNRIKAELQKLRQADHPAAEIDENGEPVERGAPIEGTVELEQRLSAELSARQNQLRADYAARHAEIVGPVQTRVGRRAQTFAGGHGCAGLKLARKADLPSLQSTGAQDITAEFVAWYAQNGAT